MQLRVSLLEGCSHKLMETSSRHRLEKARSSNALCGGHRTFERQGLVVALEVCSPGPGLALSRLSGLPKCE